MERHSIFMDWKTQHSKDANSYRLIHRLNESLIKISAEFLVDMDKVNLKFIWEDRRAKTFFKMKNTFGGITSTQSYDLLYKALVMKQ